ncbi:MAG: CHAT domain-containing protein [Anaerolineae bacterium]
MLASCQSAGAGDDPTPEAARPLASLGPQLAEAGAPAVVAMQGNISMETASHFMSASCSRSWAATVWSTGRWPWRAARCESGPTGGCRCCSCACAAGGSAIDPASATTRRGCASGRRC